MDDDPAGRRRACVGTRNRNASRVRGSARSSPSGGSRRLSAPVLRFEFRPSCVLFQDRFHQIREQAIFFFCQSNQRSPKFGIDTNVERYLCHCCMPYVVLR